MTPDRVRWDGQRLRVGLARTALMAATIALMGPPVSLAFAGLPRDDFYVWWAGVTIPMLVAAGAAALSVIALVSQAIVAHKRKGQSGDTESVWAIAILAVAAIFWTLMVRWMFSWPLT